MHFPYHTRFSQCCLRIRRRKLTSGQHELRISAGAAPVPTSSSSRIRASATGATPRLPRLSASTCSGTLLRSIGASRRHVPTTAGSHSPALISNAAAAWRLLRAAGAAGNRDCEGERGQLRKGLLPVCPVHGSVLPVLPGLSGAYLHVHTLFIAARVAKHCVPRSPTFRDDDGAYKAMASLMHGPCEGINPQTAHLTHKTSTGERERVLMHGVLSSKGIKKGLLVCR